MRCKLKSYRFSFHLYMILSKNITKAIYKQKYILAKLLIFGVVLCLIYHPIAYLIVLLL
uniref:Uncharacterized protein n=1 Tax=Bartonella rochalimae ATCC BAA-1498 TaxID=685782 RepID=E6YMT7_9HYPH|nr:hypothetical protein BARRO_80039 [Bartonella rochalimae ATCC BAA-1498]